MLLPKPFHMQKDNYEEGVIYFYNFIDSAYIIVFQGTMMEFPIDKYQWNGKMAKGNRTIYFGITDNKFWRKDVCEGIRIYYGNVPKKKKELYDKVLDGIKIKPL